jgi:SAM-dependent methyltransferase
LSELVRHYDTIYGIFVEKVSREVRAETFGEDIGQNSWLTADEFRRFFADLQLSPKSNVLDVACGSGGPALYLTRSMGCRMTGIDINEKGVGLANQTAGELGLDSQITFLKADAGKPLPFDDQSFDAAYCIDSINHLPSRSQVLSEWHRVLKPFGRLLFTDPIIVTGLLSNEEMMIRSSIGYFVYAPPDGDERLLKSSGFRLLSKWDATGNVSKLARRRYDARAKHQDDLVKIEGHETFQGTQRFYSMAHKLAAERRLSRFVYLAER